MSAAHHEEALLSCRNCATRNDADRKFCKECGAPLYGPCPECGETVGLVEKFCGGCGFHVGEVFHERLQAARSVFQEGAALRAATQFAAAQQTLRRLAVDADPLLHGLRRQAEQELRQCEIDLRAAESRRDELLKSAQTAHDQADFDRAVALLSQIPDAVQTEHVKQLLERAVAFRDESEQLVRTIRDALAAKQHLGLLPHVERLLVLKPNHQQARDMIDKLRALEHQGQAQLRDRNHELAKRKLSECKYDEAQQLLESVAADKLTPDVERTLAYARETAWLARQLRTALVTTDTLVRLGERLLKLQSADQAVARLLEQLRQRRGNKFSASIRGVPPTAAVGCAVEYPAPWRNITVDASISAALAPRSGQFHAAAGLALEGIGKAKLTPKLQLAESENLWRRMSRAVRKRDARVAWGIDLGNCTLKAIRLRLRDDGSVFADAAESLSHERLLSQPGVDVVSTIKNTWQRLAAKHDLASGQICVNFAGQALLSRSFKLPPVEDKKLPELMKFEAPGQIPVPIDSVAWDYHVFRHDDPANRYDREAALFAVKQQVLRERIDQFVALDVRPDVLQADCVAIYNLLALEGKLPAPGASDSADDFEEEVTMALDIGAESTDVLVGHSRSFWTRVMPFGGSDFTKALVKELKLTFADAERQKRQPFTAPAAHVVDRALDGAFQAFAAELQRTMTYYGTQQRRRRIGRVILLGGGARLHGLYEALWLGR